MRRLPQRADDANQKQHEDQDRQDPYDRDPVPRQIETGQYPQARNEQENDRKDGDAHTISRSDGAAAPACVSSPAGGS